MSVEKPFYDQYSLDDLYIRVTESDREAFDHLYHQMWRKLYTVAFRKLQDENIAKDVIQELFIEIWDNRKKRQILAVEKYLYQAVRFKVINCYRKRKVNFEELETVAGTLADYTAGADIPYFEKELRATIDRWIDRLPKKRRAIFLLRYQEDKSTKEISTLLNVSPKTVQNQLLNTTNMLKILLQKMLLLFLLIFL